MSAVAPTVTVTPAQSSIVNTQTLSVVIAVAGSGATPTGTVALASGTYASSAVTLVDGFATIVVPAATLTIAASDTLTATYTPDTASSAAYTTATGTANVAVTAVTVSLPTKLQGYKAQLAYVNSAGASILVAGLKELDGGFTVEELDSTDHSNDGWKSRMAGLNDFDGSAKLDYIEGDSSQKYLLSAVMNHTPLRLTLLPIDAAGSGAQSFVGPAIITAWKWDGKNTDLQGVQITLKGNGPFSVVTQ
jgi:predicted secreted protein